MSFKERYNNEKVAVDLNVLHDVAQAVPHVMHGLGQAADAIGHGIGKAFDWAKDTVTRPFQDPSGKALKQQIHNQTPTYEPDYSPAQAKDIATNTTTLKDVMHGINAVGVGVALPGAAIKGTGMAINKAIDTFGDRKTQRDRNKFLRNHPIIDKLSFKERYAQQKTANQYIEKQGDKRVITQKGTGKVLSHHDTKEKAGAAFSAMMVSKHGGKERCTECSRFKGDGHNECSGGKECKTFVLNQARDNGSYDSVYGGGAEYRG